MVSMLLMALWGTFDFFLLAAGGVMIAFSILWKAPDVFRNLILSDMDLTGASPPPLGCSAFRTDHMALVTNSTLALKINYHDAHLA